MCEVLESTGLNNVPLYLSTTAINDESEGCTATMHGTNTDRFCDLTR